MVVVVVDVDVVVLVVDVDKRCGTNDVVAVVYGVV